MWPAAAWAEFDLLLFSHINVLGESNQTLGAFSCHQRKRLRFMNALNHIFCKDSV